MMRAFLFTAFLLLASFQSQAAYVFRSELALGSRGWGGTPAESCDNWAANAGRAYVIASITETIPDQLYKCFFNENGEYVFALDTLDYYVATCPAWAPNEQPNGQCLADPPVTCADTEGQPVSWLSATGTDGCVDGCTTGGVTACFNIPKIVNGVTTAEYHCSSDYSSTGTSCTGGGDTQTQPLIETCAAGQIAGDFNGSLQCVDSTTGQIVDTSPDATQTTTSNTTSSTVDNGDGTSTKTDTTTTTNPNGSTNTSTTTTNYDSGGNVTNSSTVNNFTGKDSNGDGTPDGTGEGEGEGEDTESTFAASACGTAPACEGDAIQCAIATQQHEANCLITGDGSPITTEALLGAGEATTLQVDPSNQYDISGMLDTSSFVAGACPAPRTISVNGQDMTIDYTELCNLADILGYLVMFTASIISLRVIGGAF